MLSSRIFCCPRQGDFPLRQSKHAIQKSCAYAPRALNGVPSRDVPTTELRIGALSLCMGWLMSLLLPGGVHEALLTPASLPPSSDVAESLSLSCCSVLCRPASMRSSACHMSARSFSSFLSYNDSQGLDQAQMLLCSDNQRQDR